ncbi:MAG: DUF188 domain-containing protein [Peptostreptococcaceae bacterium]|nr:DUF188 domain-containing protein [Peptostreptococcaceae bacterium]
MSIFIDADGCPVVSLSVKMAALRGMDAFIVKNYSHEIENAYATVITVDKSLDSADYYIANHIKLGDIVVTQDYGLAAMVLSRGGKCITQNGLVISDVNIGRLLGSRHMNHIIRKGGGRGSRFKKRSPENDRAFEASLKELLDSNF